MIEFLSVSLRNFLSYGNNNTTVSLQRPGTTLIIGENMDNTTDGKGGNGVGKSSIINAIVFALYDKAISPDVAKDDLINNINKRNMEVAVEFIAHGINYIVRRERKAKEGNNVYLIVDGEDKTLDSMDKTNAEIVRILGMPYDMFVRIVIFSAQQKSFLDLPSRHPTQANQTDFIEELFGLTTLSAKAELLKLAISDNERAITSEKTRISILEKEQERHDLQVTSMKKRVIAWEMTNTQTINDLNEQLSKLGNVDINEQQLLFKELKTQQTKLSEASTTIKTLTSEYARVEKKLLTLREELVQLKSNTCPYCHQEFHDTLSKIQSIDNDIDSANTRLLEVDEAVEALATTVEELNVSIAALKQQITVDDIEELIEISAESGNIASKISELQQAMNPHIDVLDEMITAQPDAIDYTVINDLTNIQDHQKFLLKLLTKKNSFVRKQLLDNNIPFLNTRLQHYLTCIGLTHKVEFTTEMTAAISQFGQPLGFGNLSAGQRARVNIALSLAFRDVLQQLHQSVNICMFDEVLDIGLDGVGITSVAHLLKRIAKDELISMFIISHKSEVENMFDSTITVQLSKGFSYIKENNIG